MHGYRNVRVFAALFGAILAIGMTTTSVSASSYEGTDPVTTPCGNGNNPIYTIGKRTVQSPVGDSGIPVPIMAGGVKIGEVEIRHSAKCATVWSRVTNLSGGSADVHETLVTYSSSNGDGRVEHQAPGVDTIGNGHYAWSLQYDDTASFSAKGGILFNGTWYWAETARTVAWVQYKGKYASIPYACTHQSPWECERWATPNGQPRTVHYGLDTSLATMPSGSQGQTNDVRPDVRFMFDQFNGVPGGSPFFDEVPFLQAEVTVFEYWSDQDGAQARAAAYTNSGSHIYVWGIVELNSFNHNWGDQDLVRQTLCHETDHLLGLGHVWWTDGAGVNNLGSKATCIGANMPGGPGKDDNRALKAVYSGVVP